MQILMNKLINKLNKNKKFKQILWILHQIYNSFYNKINCQKILKEERENLKK